MLFEIKAEVRDSAVTLSPALAKYMIKKNQGDEKELRVMPFREEMTDCKLCDECTIDMKCPTLAIYGWDINPTVDMGLEEEYIASLEVLQWNDEERSVGFLMDNPNVTGLLVQYGMRDAIHESMDTGRPVTLYVRPREMFGRTQYIIERTQNIGLIDRIDLWLTRMRMRLWR